MDSALFPTTDTDDGHSRRHFMKLLVGSSALSLAALNRASAAVYDSIARLNQQYPPNQSPDGAYWAEIRRHFLMQGELCMMNNGTVGPMPEPVFNTLVKYFRIQVTNPFDVYNFYSSRKEEVRRKLAQFINASPEEVVISRNTTEGMNFIAGGLELGAGDEVIISTMEHPGGLHPWLLKAKRHGITVKDVPLGLPPKSVHEVTDAFAGAITPRTKVISLSHTVFISGLIAPVRELSEIAHERDILVLVDSAHGLGMLNLDMKELGIDFFTSSPYKWLGAPTGSGLLYVRREVQDRVWPTIASSGWDTREDATRLETLSQRADPIIFALGEAIDFQDRIGRSRIERRIRTLATRLKEALAETPGVRLHTSMDPYLSGGLTAFSMRGVAPETIVNYLREKYNIVIRTIGSDEAGTRGVRVSTHYYISDVELDRLIAGVRFLAGA
jgi:selenocysteine lyase/cysteine desulfurase